MIGLSLAGYAGIAAAQPDRTFDEIMQSISRQGSLPNGDGHRWRFRQKSDGSWEVEGARSETAEVTEAGPGLVEIDGFPAHWGANGRYEFSVDGDTCRLKSRRSNHRLTWGC